MKRKNSSDYTVERVYNFILNCGGFNYCIKGAGR